MSRHTSPLVLGLTLAVGVLIGLAAGRGGPSLSAQATGRPAPAAAAASEPARASEAGRAGATDQAVYEQLARQYSRFEEVNRTFEMVSRAVAPAVVHIVAEKHGPVDESQRVRHYEETGSGVIVRGDHTPNLYVLTNNHVVAGTSPAKIAIFLLDGRSIRPDQVWLDEKADMAVLRLARNDLPAARMGDSDEAAVGSWVLALGSPFGLTHSVSQGIISARGRHMDELEDVENQDFLQTDAAINPGNSGGPLVNMKGEVIGINNSIASSKGENTGVGFSIPINLARWIMNQLVTTGRVTRGALGIDLDESFGPEAALRVGLERPRGAWVKKVHRSTPAEKGGLRDGDVILSFRGHEVRDLNDLINMVSMSPVGQPADLVIWRNRQQYSLSVTVGDREQTVVEIPASERSAATRGGLLRRPDRPPSGPSFAQGAELQTVDEALKKALNLPGTTRGVVVLKVEPDGRLAGVLQPFDVINAINGRGVATAEEAVAALNKPAPADGMTIGFDRVVKGMVERRSVRLK
jgi:serine protease Do